MEIPRHVFKQMRGEFKELEPLFHKFVHSHINPQEVEAIINGVDAKRATGELAFHDDPYETNKQALGELKKALREVGVAKYERIRDVYEKCNGQWQKSFMKTVQQRCDDEVWEPNIESSWRDFTSIYPDKFDGDNISEGNFHSCKFNDIQTPGDAVVWSHGHACHSIQALVWRICGLYKEFCKEPDVIVSEDSRVDVVEELIRLSHYVMDLSTIVHLMKTSTSFHNNFEEDLDAVVDELLPHVTITVNQNVRMTVKNDAYGEADKRAKQAFEKYYFPVLDLYGVNNSKRTRAFRNNLGKDLAEDMITNACQNMADFWMYALELMKVEQSMYNHVLNNDLEFSI